MKYIVEVNAKYLVSIEAETQLSAEHKVLEYDGIWGALAFDNDAMKTDTFIGAVQGCEMVSMKELEAMSKEYADAYVEKAKALDAHRAADGEVERLEALLALAKENRRIASQNIDIADMNVAAAVETIGKRKD